MRYPDSRILIFAKAPEPGRVKTRLIPVLGPEGAVGLHTQLLTGVVGRLASAAVARLELWCAPDPGFDLFRDLASAYGLALHRQEGRDLGERMLHAAGDALSRCRSLVLVGADCPLLDGRYVARALDALADRDAVIGPAQDGGYVLLGLNRAAPELFRDMPWGEDRVTALTRGRMGALGWAWKELPTLWDVDSPGDLERCRAQRPRMSSSTALLPK